MCLEDIKLGRREYYKVVFNGAPVPGDVIAPPNPNRVGLVFMFNNSNQFAAGSIGGSFDPVTGAVTETFAFGAGNAMAAAPSIATFGGGVGVTFGADSFNPPLRIEQWGQLITAEWKCAGNPNGIAWAVIELVLKEYSAQNVGPGNE